METQKPLLSACMVGVFCHPEFQKNSRFSQHNETCFSESERKESMKKCHRETSFDGFFFVSCTANAAKICFIHELNTNDWKGDGVISVTLFTAFVLSLTLKPEQLRMHKHILLLYFLAPLSIIIRSNVP